VKRQYFDERISTLTRELLFFMISPYTIGSSHTGKKRYTYSVGYDDGNFSTAFYEKISFEDLKR